MLLKFAIFASIATNCLVISTQKIEIFRRYNEAEEDGYRFPTLTYLDENSELKVEMVEEVEDFLIPHRYSMIFELYTRKNQAKSEDIRGMMELSYSENFTPTNPTIFFVHDWLSGTDDETIQEVKESLLEKQDLNVFLVNWTKSAKDTYVNASRKVLYEGQYLSEFLDDIMGLYGIPGSEVTLICHGVGAHLCGICGYTAKDTIGTIIALDPAGPRFPLNELNYRLDESDAEFVQVIHTNAAVRGFDSSIGHADFYPNGGSSQPGCEKEISGECSHHFSIKILKKAIDDGKITGWRCRDYDEFQSGSCSSEDRQSHIGFPVDKTATGDYYFDIEL